MQLELGKKLFMDTLFIENSREYNLDMNSNYTLPPLDDLLSVDEEEKDNKNRYVS
jgi:hypothetical protein